MTTKFHSSLSEDLSLMLNDVYDHNVIIQVGRNQNIKEFRAHSNILRARSPYFKNELEKERFQRIFIASAEGVITNDNTIEFKKPNINPTIFEMILK